MLQHPPCNLIGPTKYIVTKVCTRSKRRTLQLLDITLTIHSFATYTIVACPSVHTRRLRSAIVSEIALVDVYKNLVCSIRLYQII